MGLESATHIDDLVSTNPLGSDNLNTADDHIRLIKSVLTTDFASITGVVTATHTELNLLAGYTGAIPELGTAQEWTATQNFNATTLTDGATINWNAAANQVCSVTLAGNRTMAAPTNQKDGGTYVLQVIQDATGSRTLSWNAVFKWPSGVAPTLSTAANARDIVSCVSDGTNMYCNILLDVK